MILDFYEGMCKTFLWPIFHYLALPDDLDKKSEAESWNAYYETNLVYAKKVVQVYRPGDLVGHVILRQRAFETFLI
jgi:trehalose 6-phosphate synthase/phosphatase